MNIKEAQKYTEEQAKDLQNSIVKMARLHALVSELNGLKEFVLNDNNYYIAFNVQDDSYEVLNTLAFIDISVVFIEKTCAKKIVEMLNNGEFELLPKELKA